MAILTLLSIEISVHYHVHREFDWCRIVLYRLAVLIEVEVLLAALVAAELLVVALQNIVKDNGIEVRVCG